MANRVRATSSRSGLFLIELIAAIGLFALASAVCVQLFAQAHLISEESRNLSQAMLRAQSAAECFKAAAGDLEHAFALLGEGDLTDEGALVVRYDGDWRPLARSTLEEREGERDHPAFFQLTLLPSQAAGVRQAHIKVERLFARHAEDGTCLDSILYELWVKAASL